MCSGARWPVLRHYTAGGDQRYTHAIPPPPTRFAKHFTRALTQLIPTLSACTGKSTLAALLSSKLGISTVLSTDFVRHLLRKVPAARGNRLDLL